MSTAVTARVDPPKTGVSNRCQRTSTAKAANPEQTKAHGKAQRCIIIIAILVEYRRP